MSRKVTVQLPTGRSGRPRGRAVGAGVAPGAPDAADSAPPAKVPRVARVLALAHHWRGLIRSGVVRDQADLARLVGVSRARVTQVMSLLHLAPDIQQEILFASGSEDDIVERRVREIAALRCWSAQLTTWTGARESPSHRPLLPHAVACGLPRDAG